MIELEDGLVQCGRCVCGMKVGYIIDVGQTTYTIRWLDGNTTTQLRPDWIDPDEDIDPLFEQPEEIDIQALAFDHAHDLRKNWVER